MYKSSKYNNRRRRSRKSTIVQDRIADDRVMNLEARRTSKSSMLDRLDMERAFTNYDNDNSFGEFTGESMGERGFVGMPLYPNFKSKSSVYDQNSHLDFDLGRISDSRIDTSRLYYEDDGDYSNINNRESMYTNSYDVTTRCINNAGLWFGNNILDKSNVKTGVSGYGIVNIMGVMYMMSQSYVRDDIANFFTFKNKKSLNAGLLTVRENLSSCRSGAIVDSYIISSYVNRLNKGTASDLKQLAYTYIVNPDQYESETERINDNIQRISKVDNVLSENTLRKIGDGVLLLNVCRFNVRIRNYRNMRMMYYDDRFYSGNKVGGMKKRRITYMRFSNVRCKMYETQTCSGIEIPLITDNHVLGIVMGSNKIDMIPSIVNNSNDVVLDDVMIPLINSKYKIRLNGTFKNNGLSSVFSEDDYIKLFPDEARVKDIIQVQYINFSASDNIKTMTDIPPRNEKTFYANKEFVYYIRDTVNEVIESIILFK